MAALAFSLASICLQTISNSTSTKRIMASQLSPSPKFTLHTWHLLSLYRCCYEYAEWTSHPLVTEHVLCEQLEAIQYQKLKLQHSSSSVLLARAQISSWRALPTKAGRLPRKGADVNQNPKLHNYACTNTAGVALI